MDEELPFDKLDDIKVQPKPTKLPLTNQFFYWTMLSSGKEKAINQGEVMGVVKMAK